MIAAPLLLLALAAPLDDARAAVAQAGDYPAASTAYGEVVREIPGCGDLEYDLGTVAAQAAQVGPAVLHLERALKLSPWDSDARQNLEKIRGRRVDKVAANELGDSPWQRLLLGLPSATVAWLAVLLWVAAFLMLAFFQRRLVRRAALVGMLVAIVLGPVGWRRAARASAIRYGVVLAPTGTGGQGPLRTRRRSPLELRSPRGSQGLDSGGVQRFHEDPVGQRTRGVCARRSAGGDLDRGVVGGCE